MTAELETPGVQDTGLTAERLGFTEAGNTLVKDIKGERYEFSLLQGIDELSEAVALQQTVWELSDADVCPSHMWVTAQDTGGHVLGVRNEKRELVGFAVGFGGYDLEEGHPFVLSDMAAVRADSRDLNIGYNLKLAQALHVSRQGIEEIRWTYDPLRSRNAYLNLSKLGAVATRFYIDKYGNSLVGGQNADITDRFLARWFVDEPQTQNRLINGRTPIIIDGISIVREDYMPEDPRVAVEIPIDIELLSSAERISEQLRFRNIALSYISNRGYQAVDYVLHIDEEDHKKGFYILSNNER